MWCAAAARFATDPLAKPPATEWRRLTARVGCAAGIADDLRPCIPFRTMFDQHDAAVGRRICAVPPAGDVGPERHHHATVTDYDHIACRMSICQSIEYGADARLNFLIAFAVLRFPSPRAMWIVIRRGEQRIVRSTAMHTDLALMQIGFDPERYAQLAGNDACGLAGAQIGTRNHQLGAK